MASAAAEDARSSLTTWVTFAEGAGAGTGAGRHDGIREELGNLPGSSAELKEQIRRPEVHWSTRSTRVLAAEKKPDGGGTGDNGEVQRGLDQTPEGLVELGGDFGGRRCTGARGRSQRRTLMVAEAVRAGEATTLLAEGWRSFLASRQSSGEDPE